MKYIFSFASILIIPSLGFSQSFNTVLLANNPNTITIKKEITIEVKSDLTESINVAATDHSMELETIDNFLSTNLFASLPLSSVTLTSSFGYRTHPVTKKHNSFHSGVDLVANRDTVYSILHGVVESSGYNKLLGNYVRIKHGDYSSIYGHLSTRFVATNDIVNAGFPLGISGSTGRVTGEHLHFTVKYRETYINPLPFLSKIIKLKGRDLLSTIQTKI